MDRVCAFCSEKGGKYVCPRCNALYCSVDCYRAESHLQCSEAFYKECIENEIQSADPNVDARNKMVEILKRMQRKDEGEEDEGDLDSDDYSEDGDVMDIATRLKDVDLDNADDIWNRLTDDERREFEELLKTGDVERILPTFEPWWRFKDAKKVVELEESTGKDDSSATFKNNCPKVKNNVVPFTSISKSQPAPAVSFNVANIIAAYTVIVRYYNGEHVQYAGESVSLMSTISTNLSLNQNFPSLEHAVKSVRHEIMNCQWLSGIEGVGSELENDIGSIFEGPGFSDKTFYVSAALGDMHTLFRTAKVSKPSQGDGEEVGEFSKRFHNSSESSLPELAKSKVKLCLKKIEYYQSWVKDHYVSPL